MKKLVLVLAIMMAITATSCKQSTNDQITDTAKDTVKVDSTKADSTKVDTTKVNK